MSLALQDFTATTIFFLKKNVSFSEQIIFF